MVCLNPISTGEYAAVDMAKVGIGQFQHYKYNVINLMFKWMKDAGISVAARDLRSEEFITPFRFFHITF